MTFPTGSSDAADQPGLSAERTALAWGRTLIGISATLGLVAAHAARADRWTVAAVAALVAVTVLAFSWPVSQLRYARLLDDLTAGVVVTAAAAVAVVALAAACFVVVLL